MEGAQLRPVPARPPGPVDPAEAVRHVRDFLPGLDEPAASALALVALAGRPRDELDGTPEEVGHALARARKDLRRSMFPLPGSGWCERAERLISDRIDGDIEPPGPARLAVHLRNCNRCVEHERKLAQATDSMVLAFVESHPQPEPQAEPEPEPEPSPPPAAELRVVEPDEEPEAATSAEPTAPPAAPKRRTERSLATLAWTGLFAFAVLLAVVSVVLLVLGVLGGHF
jgi:putative zinc finger protein